MTEFVKQQAAIKPPKSTATLSMHEFIAGWVGGAAGVFVGHPLDTIKVRMQAAKSRSSMLTVSRHMLLHEGPKSFFRGMTFPLASAGPSSALWFAGYEMALRKVEQISPSTNSKLIYYQNVYIAGCLGYFFCLPITNVVDVVKVNMQMRTTPSQRPFVYAFVKLRQIYQQFGLFRGVFRGFQLQAWRDVPTAGVYFLTYEAILDCLAKCEAYARAKRRSASKSEALLQDALLPRERTTLHILLAGGLAGTLCWLTSLPQDVVKTRYQVLPLREHSTAEGQSSSRRVLVDEGSRSKLEPVPGLWRACSRIVAEEGWRALFKGAVPMSVRAFPVNAVTFFGYEMTIRLIGGRNPKNELT